MRHKRCSFNLIIRISYGKEFKYTDTIPNNSSRLLIYSWSTFNLDSPLYTTVNCTVLKMKTVRYSILSFIGFGSRLNVDQIRNKRGALSCDNTTFEKDFIFPSFSTSVTLFYHTPAKPFNCTSVTLFFYQTTLV